MTRQPPPRPIDFAAATNNQESVCLYRQLGQILAGAAGEGLMNESQFRSEFREANRPRPFALAVAALQRALRQWRVLRRN